MTTAVEDRHVPGTGFWNGASTLKQHFVLPRNGSKYYLKYTFLVFPVLGIFGLGTSLDTLVGPFGTLCGCQLSCQFLLLLRCLFWLRSGEHLIVINVVQLQFTLYYHDVAVVMIVICLCVSCTSLVLNIDPVGSHAPHHHRSPIHGLQQVKKIVSKGRTSGKVNVRHRAYAELAARFISEHLGHK